MDNVVFIVGKWLSLLALTGFQQKLILSLLILEWLSFLTAIFGWRKLGKDKYFVLAFLGTVILTETVNFFIRFYIYPADFVDKVKTWSNIMLPAQCLSILVLFYNKTRFHYWRIAIVGFVGVVLFITFLQVLIGNISASNTFNSCLMYVFISACSLHYLFELMNSEEIAEVTRDPIMYISIGLLLFYLGTLPFSSMRVYLYESHRKIFYTYYYLFFAFNYFLYSIITFGILWAKKK